MGRRPTALAPHDPAESLAHYQSRAIEVIFDQIEADLGGRSGLLQNLLTAPDDPTTAHLIGLLADPTSDAVKLSTLMHHGGVSLPQLLQVMTQAGFARAFLKSVAVIAEKTPAVVHDVLDRAAPHYLACPNCAGMKTVSPPGQPDAPPVLCESCKGTGQQLILPDLDRQKLALDLARLLPQKAAIIQHFDQRKSMGSGSVEGMTALIRATDDLLAHARPAPRAPQSPMLEGEVVSPPSDAVDSPPS